MKTIIEKETGLLLYCRPDEPTEPNELAINECAQLKLKAKYFIILKLKNFIRNDTERA